MQSFKTLIDVDTLRDSLGDPALVVVDCRFDLMNADKGRAEYLEGHVPGAVYADLDHDLSAPVGDETGRHPLPGVEELQATFRRLGISGDSQVVAYDGGPGGIAARLWWLLHWLGHERAAVLDGGCAVWQAAAGPVEDTEPAPAAGDFLARPREGRVLTTAELARALEAGRMPALVDAREAARFRGDSEPIDTVAGHVPGAMNFPFAKNIAESGRWRKPRELRAEWEALFDGKPPPDWAVMCGSGVTACHLALSAAVAGLPAPRLYAGSWSEWIRDPARPREAGWESA